MRVRVCGRYYCSFVSQAGAWPLSREHLAGGDIRSVAQGPAMAVQLKSAVTSPDTLCCTREGDCALPVRKPQWYIHMESGYFV